MKKKIRRLSTMKTKTPKPDEIKRWLNFSIALSKEAGKLLLTYQKKIKKLKITYKQAQGVVSLADIKTEEMIFKKIRKKYPDHEIMGEEESFKSHRSSFDYSIYKKKKLLWIIDPLDGTHNFLNGSDYYCVSIALVHYGVPILGAVYRPVTKELFFSSSISPTNYKGHLNTKSKNELCSHRNNKKMSDSIMVTGFASEKGIFLREELVFMEKIMSRSRGIRRFGSAALDLCYVALGVWDGFFEKNLSPWDVAAAGLILERAGGKVTDYNGKKFNPFQHSILGSRPPLHHHLLKLLKSRRHTRVK